MFFEVQKSIPSRFFIKPLANSKKMTRNPTPAAPPTIMATVFLVFCPVPAASIKSHPKSKSLLYIFLRPIKIKPPSNKLKRYCTFFTRDSYILIPIDTRPSNL